MLHHGGRALNGGHNFGTNGNIEKINVSEESFLSQGVFTKEPRLEVWMARK
jgi:hypothetical protein